jgi:two-component system, sensor histidine kinase and response regulator
MPEMDGLQATQAIRQRLGRTDLPIIAMTANAMPADRELCLAAGMDDHIGKPFDLKKLVAQLRYWVYERRGVAPPAPGTVLAQVSAAADATPPAGSTASGRPGAQPSPSLRVTPGFDPEAAADRLGGDPDFYRALLGRFVGEVPAIQARLADRSAGTAALWAATCHSIKGTAATLGFTALAHAAAEAERAFKQRAATDINTLDMPPLFDQIERLSDLVSKAREAAQRWLGDAQGPEVSPNAEEMIDLTEGLQALIQCLNDSDLQALDVHERLKRWRQPATEPLWHTLDMAMHDLDFDRASQLAAKLLEIILQKQAPPAP